jgi:hypothetical protein
MVRKKVSSEENDPTLSPGWSYYCEVTKYMEYLATGVEREEVCTCRAWSNELTSNLIIAVDMRQSPRYERR